MTIIFYRDTRGIGDAMMLLRTIELWRACEPDATIVVVMNRPASAVFEQHPAVDEIRTVGEFDISFYDEATFYNVSDCCLNYEKQCMWHRMSIEKNRTEVFAETCGIEYDGVVGTMYYTEAELEHIYSKVRELREKPTQKLVGIVWKSGREWSNYPHVKLLAEYFERKKSYVPIVIDEAVVLEDIYTTSEEDFREVLVLITQLDAVVGPDTGPMHVAAAAGIPTLWLFGPTDPRVRLRDYENAEYIWKPCDKKRPCWYNFCESVDCMFNLSPWKVGRKVKGILKDDTLRRQNWERKSRSRRPLDFDAGGRGAEKKISMWSNIHGTRERTDTAEE